MQPADHDQEPPALTDVAVAEPQASSHSRCKAPRIRVALEGWGGPRRRGWFCRRTTVWDIQLRGPADRESSTRHQRFARKPVLVKDEDDSGLVQRCQAGDRRAFERLVARYQKPVFNAALRMLRNPQDALDVAQTTFLKAFEHLKDYDPSFRFYSWIYRIAVNESLNALGSRKALVGIDDQEPDDAPGPELQAEADQTGREIEAALFGLSPELRAVIVLRHFLHLSYRDMADTLQLPEKTVKSRLHSARHLLRAKLLPRATV
jgi:RNA polymerase sigma-70 factor (ECF subfamily)